MVNCVFVVHFTYWEDLLYFFTLKQSSRPYDLDSSQDTPSSETRSARTSENERHNDNEDFV